MTRRIDYTMNKQRRARRQPREMTLRETFSLCPYRSLLGFSADLDPDPERLMGRVGCAIAIIGRGKPEPLRPEMLADALAVLSAGRVVLLLSDDRAQRDFTKQEIFAMAGPAGGAA